MSFFLGIDPGVGGGIACLSDEKVVYAHRMPETDRDLVESLQGEQIMFATLERVRSSPQMGVTSAFTFGVGYGRLRMALVALQIPFDEVSPLKWQNVMGCRSGGDKNITKARAQELFPQIKVTHFIADALLLAEFCRRSRTGR